MTNWHVVHDSRVETPPALEENTSSTTVYERRNVRQETADDGMDGEVTQWVYEQREYTKDEYQMLQLMTVSLAAGGIYQLRADIDFLAVMQDVEL